MKITIERTEINVMAQRFYEASGLNLSHTSKPQIVAGLRHVFELLGVEIADES